MQLKTIILNGISLLLWGMLIPSLSAQIYSDTTWERWFFGPPHYETTTGVKHVEYYDKGYLLGTSFGDDWGEYAKLIKTDINGYYLWDRTFDTLVFNRVRGISVSDDGSIYCVGFFELNGLSNPWVFKLNACGEMLWCRIFEWDNVCYGNNIEIDRNGDIVVLTNYYGGIISKRINLIKLRPDGELLWKKDYATIEDHPYIWNSTASHLMISESNDYYITGRAMWPTNNDPSQGSGWRPFFIKVNENGNEEWVLPFGIYHSIVGNADKTIQINDTLFLGESSDWLPEPPTTVFVWYGPEGQVYSHKSVHIDLDGIYASYIHDTHLLEDNSLWGILLYSAFENDLYSHFGYLHLDTAINVLNYKIDDRWSQGSSKRLIRTFNNKFVTVTAMNEEGSNVEDAYITKRNIDYTYDTVYTNWPGHYDTLCPHAIESGYLPYECEPTIVGMQEWSEKETNGALSLTIIPNPSKNKVKVGFENNNYKELNLQIFNINGEEVFNRQLHSYPQDTEIDISNLAKGVYLVSVRNEGIIVGRAKLVVD
jgi:hypothetical protein